MHMHICTSKRRLHGGLHEAGQELGGLGLLGQAGTERSQGISMPAEALQCYALPVVRL